MSCYSPWLNFGLWPIPVSSLGYSWVASNFRTLVMRKQHTVHLHSFLHLSCFPIKGFIVFVLVLKCAHMVRVQLWVKRHFDAFPPNQQCLCPTVGTSETLPNDNAATLRNNGKWEGTVSIQMGYPPLWKFGVSTQTHTHTRLRNIIQIPTNHDLEDQVKLCFCNCMSRIGFFPSRQKLVQMARNSAL